MKYNTLVIALLRRVLLAAVLSLGPAPAGLGQPHFGAGARSLLQRLGLHSPFSSGATEAPVEKGEMKTYLDMLVRAFVPRFMVLEASANPMPLLGAPSAAVRRPFITRPRSRPASTSSTRSPRASRSLTRCPCSWGKSWTSRPTRPHCGAERRATSVTCQRRQLQHHEQHSHP